MLDKIKIILLINILFFSFSFSQSWETIGGNSARTSFLNVVGPQKKPEILWEGTLPAPIGGGLPILISDNKLVTTRAKTWEDAPIVCHDLYTGDTLWTLDFTGGDHSTSIPVGFRNNVVYASNWLGHFKDTLYAINADNGKIIWKSDELVLGEYSLGIAFTSSGDIIIPAYDLILRINKENGDTIWSTERDVPVTASYCGISVFNDVSYGWELGTSNELRVIAINVETGKIKYGIEIPIAGNSHLGVGPLLAIDNNGVIYAHRADNNFVAIKDDGDSLSILWNIPIENGGGTAPAIGPDGTVYFTNHDKIMRANPLNGNILDSSITVQSDTSKYLNGYFAIDINGTVFFGNNTDEKILYSFTKDLQLNWTDSVKGISNGSPALGTNGILAVSGSDDILRVYKPENLFSNYQSSLNLKPQVLCVCSPGYIAFKYYVQEYTGVKLLLYNTRGQEIYTNSNMPNSPGFHCVNIKDIHENYGSGRFIYQLNIGNKSTSNTISIVK